MNEKRPSEKHPSARQVQVILVVGALAGLVLAGIGVLESRADRAPLLPDDAVAMVEDRIITRAAYQRALATLATQQGGAEALDADARRQVLERLIDEELLVGRGLELGLASRDPRVRADLGAAVVDLLTARGQEQEAAAIPDDAELERFYQDQQAFFARPARVRVEHFWFTERERAESVRQAVVRGADPATALAHLGGPAPAPVAVPDGFLPGNKLADYIGATATRFALEAPLGEFSQVMPATGGYRLLRVIEREPPRVREFAEVRAQVLSEYQRRAGERAVRHFLDTRRQRVDIVIAEDRL